MAFPIPIRMVLEHSLINKKQIGSLSALEHSLLSKDLSHLVKCYLIACKVEGKSSQTVESYRQRLDAFHQFMHGSQLPADVTGISNNHIRLFLLSLQERDLSSSTVNTYYRVLHTFFSWLVNEGIIKKTPMQNIKPPRLPKILIKPFSKQDIEKLLLLCSGANFLAVRNKAIIFLFLDTGLRLSESVSIQVEEVDFERETIRIMGKGAKERVVRIGKKTQKAILRYLLMRTDSHPCLWVSEERCPLAARGVQMTIKRLCQRANIKDATPGPHTFRHTCAINYLRNGGDVFTLQVMLGHSTLQMTRRYVSTLGAEDMIRVHQKASPVDNW